MVTASESWWQSFKNQLEWTGSNTCVSFACLDCDRQHIWKRRERRFGAIAAGKGFGKRLEKFPHPLCCMLAVWQCKPLPSLFSYLSEGSLHLPHQYGEDSKRKQRKESTGHIGDAQLMLVSFPAIPFKMPFMIFCYIVSPWSKVLKKGENVTKWMSYTHEMRFRIFLKLRCVVRRLSSQLPSSDYSGNREIINLGC